jgi:hypothetical protein
LRHVQDVREKHEKALASVAETGALDRLYELNLAEQVTNVY